MNSIFPLLSLGSDDNFIQKPASRSISAVGRFVTSLTWMGGWICLYMLFSNAARACSHDIAKRNVTSEWVVEVQPMLVHAYCVGERKGRRFLFCFVYRLSPFLLKMFWMWFFSSLCHICVLASLRRGCEFQGVVSVTHQNHPRMVLPSTSIRIHIHSFHSLHPHAHRCWHFWHRFSCHRLQELANAESEDASHCPLGPFSSYISKVIFPLSSTKFLLISLLRQGDLFLLIIVL